MDPVIIGGFVLGFLGARKELSALLERFRSKVTDFDKYFDLLQKISIETAGEQIKKNINLSEEIQLIEILENNILTGDIVQARINLSKLFRLPERKLDRILKEFKDKIINSKSSELMLALELKALEKIDFIDKKVTDLNKKIDTKESDIEETLSNLLELLRSIVDEGDLRDSYERIARINIDDLSGFDSFKEEIVLIESDIILKMGLSSDYSIQIRKLNKISNSFKRNYFLLLLYRKEFNSKKFDFEHFASKQELEPFENEIRILNSLIENSEHLLENTQIDNLHPASRKIIIKRLLINLINSNKPIRGNEIIIKYNDLLQDVESKLLILINDLNKFHYEHPWRELSKSEINYLNKLKDDFFKFESYYRDFDNKIKASFYYNLSIVLCRLSNKLAFKYFTFFRDDEKLTHGLIQFARIAGFLNEIIKITEDSPFKDKIEIYSEWVLTKFDLGDHKELVDIDIRNNNLTTKAKERIVLAQNINLFNDKKENYDENDVKLLESNRENVVIYIYLARIFNSIQKTELSEKYFEKAISYIEELSSNELMHLADTARIINKINLSKSLCKKLFDVNPYSKLLYAEVLKLETNGFKTPSIEVNNFFNSMKTDEILPLEIYRKKIEYLFSQGDKDRAIDLLRWLTSNYDYEFDWFNYINMLIDNGNFSEAKNQLYILESKTQTPIILLTIGIIQLFIDADSKLEKFAQKYFLAEKISYIQNKKLNISLLTPIWFYITRTGLYISPEPQFVKENVFVRLKKKSSDEIVDMCIHSDPNLEVPYEEEYLGCKHIHMNNEIISDLIFKKSVTLKYTKRVEQSLKSKEIISDSLSDILDSFKSKEIIGEKNYYDELSEVLRDHKQSKLIPIIMDALERTYDEAKINDETYEILSIDAIWNYPPKYLSRHFYSQPEKYGMKMVNMEPDPLKGILPELAKDRDKNIELLKDYLKGNISLFIFSHNNYEHYFGGILTLLSEKDKYFLSGVGIDYPDNHKFAISYSSLFLLTIFDKLKFLPLEKLVIPNSLYFEVQKVIKEISDTITIEQLSISLEKDSTLRKLVLGPDANRERARKWHEFSKDLKNIEKIDTINFEDEFTPLVRALGKIEVDSIRISNNLNIPLIIDDEFIHKLFGGKNITNFLPFYFQNSSEDLSDKLNFLDELSKVGYRYVLFQHFITTVIEYFLFNKGLLIGSSTPFGKFLSILQRELLISYPTNIIGELLIGIKSIINNYLCKNSADIFKEIWRVLPVDLRNKIGFHIWYFLPDFKSERDFILSCLQELE